MALGNYKSTPVYFDGIQVGEDVETEDFPVGKNCEGMTCDGESVSSMWIKGKRHDDPENISADITILRYGDKYNISTNGWSNLDEWEMLLEDLLAHVRSLK